MPPPRPDQDRPTLVLASASPRRAKLLREAGFQFEVIPPPLDDGAMRPDVHNPRAWAQALAYLKAAAVRRAWAREAPMPVILGADTIVVNHGEIIGQPRDRADAERILRALVGGEHRVITGVAILGRPGGRRMFADEALTRVGAVPDALVRAYVESGDWRGKAGAYNLEERLIAGWPIQFEGDPGTIMGLPMRRLTPILREALGDRAREGAPA